MQWLHGLRQFEQVLHLAVKGGGYFECQNGERDIDPVFNRVDTFARHLCHFGKFLLGEPRSSAMLIETLVNGLFCMRIAPKPYVTRRGEMIVVSVSIDPIPDQRFLPVLAQSSPSQIVLRLHLERLSDSMVSKRHLSSVLMRRQIPVSLRRCGRPSPYYRH